jgi:hypothetical protein
VEFQCAGLINPRNETISLGRNFVVEGAQMLWRANPAPEREAVTYE